jgi:V/A-type H+-transporting ATPase subunit I
MSIIALKKVTLYGASADAERVLERLQDFGALHVVSLCEGAQAEPEDKVVARSKGAREALRYLLDAPTKRKQSSDEDAFDLQDVVRRAVENRRRKRAVQERIDNLTARIAAVEPWGSFELPPVEDLARNRLWFYVVPHHLLRKMEAGEIPWQVVHRDERNTFVVLVSPNAPPESAMPVPRSRLGKRSLRTLRRDLEEAEAEMEEIQVERWSLTRWISLLIRNLARADDEADRTRTRRCALHAGEVYAVQGWVPARDIDRLEEFAREEGLALTHADPGPEENPPVLLENAPAVEPGEDLVGFYQLPGYGDWDPSPVVYVSFALFFAMIIADAAYGAILGLIAFVLWPKMGGSASGRRGRRMLAFISVACVVYGVMVGSYFGVTPPAESVLGWLQVLDATDFGSMIPISVGIGVLQLALANLVTAWGRRQSLSALAPAGWALALPGGFAAYIGFVPGGVAALGVGLGLVFLFTSERPIKRALDVPLRVVDGVMALTGVSKAFGDVLSYLRLFALGLSSASLALTFNQLGADVMGAGKGIALVLGLMVLVLGHGLNFVLGIVSGVVHGLRLNVIELYNWSVFGEGVPFQAFARRAEARDGSDGR